MDLGQGSELLPCPGSHGRVGRAPRTAHRMVPGWLNSGELLRSPRLLDKPAAAPGRGSLRRRREVKSSIPVRDRKGNTMNRNRFRNRQATGFFSLIAAVAFLAGTALLAQAQGGVFWNVAGPADWSSGNWTSFHRPHSMQSSGLPWVAPSSTTAERQPSPPGQRRRLRWQQYSLYRRQQLQYRRRRRQWKWIRHHDRWHPRLHPPAPQPYRKSLAPRRAVEFSPNRAELTLPIRSIIADTPESFPPCTLASATEVMGSTT